VSDKSTEVVIRGLTHEGKPFRPSDWAERLCGVMSAFGAEHRMEYSPYVQPINSGGVKCVVVSIALEELQPMAFNFLLNFAKDNELQVRPGRIAKRADEGGENAQGGGTAGDAAS
jgi:hypothetical protein